MYKQIKCISVPSKVGDIIIPYSNLVISTYGVTIESPRYSTPTSFPHRDGTHTFDAIEFDGMHIISVDAFNSLTWSEVVNPDSTVAPKDVTVTTDSDGVQFFIERTLIESGVYIYRTWVD